jgi:hypothetical protein
MHCFQYLLWISSCGATPRHIHVNSFQLSGVRDSTGDANPYYVDGDWHDVFYQPAQVVGQCMLTPSNPCQKSARN